MLVCISYGLEPKVSAQITWKFERAAITLYGCEFCQNTSARNILFFDAPAAPGKNDRRNPALNKKKMISRHSEQRGFEGMRGGSPSAFLKLRVSGEVSHFRRRGDASLRVPVEKSVQEFRAVWNARRLRGCVRRRNLRNH